MTEKAVYIDDDENADWIKTIENLESEIEIHEELAKKFKIKEGESSSLDPGRRRKVRPSR